MRRLAAGLAIALVCLAGCQASTTTAPRPSVRVSPDQSSPTCPAAAPGSELRGRASPDESLWALLFSDYPLPRSTEVKIVWRMTGSGALALTATGPNGQRVAPAWGPEQHGASTWDKPGEEWGSGFDFAAGGCWTVSASRGGNQGSVGFLVA